MTKGWMVLGKLISFGKKVLNIQCSGMPKFHWSHFPFFDVCRWVFIVSVNRGKPLTWDMMPLQWVWRWVTHPRPMKVKKPLTFCLYAHPNGRVGSMWSKSKEELLSMNTILWFWRQDDFARHHCSQGLCTVPGASPFLHYKRSHFEEL